MTYNRTRMSRIFPWKERWIWGPLLAFSFVPAMVAHYTGAGGQTVSAIFFVGMFVSMIVNIIFDPRGPERRTKPDA